jgi:hypothetical protein
MSLTDPNQFSLPTRLVLSVLSMLILGGCRVPFTDTAAFKPEPVGVPPSAVETEGQQRSEHVYVPRAELTFPENSQELPKPGSFSPSP